MAAQCDLAKPVQAVVQAARDGKNLHHQHHSDSSTLSQESATMLLSISSNSKGEYKDGDLFYPLFGSHMTGLCVQGLEEGEHLIISSLMRCTTWQTYLM